MALQGKKIFVAGATGLAGASIMAYILKNCPETRIRVSFFRTDPFLHDERIEYIRGDLTSREECRRMVAGCDGAIMVAAKTGGAQMSLAFPWEQVSDNVIMGVQMLHSLCLENVSKLVFCSTASVYQVFEGAIREGELDMNRDPHPAYFGVGWVQRYLEKLCRFWYEKSGLEVIIARSANIYGPFAKFDPAFSHFVPALIRKAVDKMDPFEVWGRPEVARDIIYGEDFARAMVMLLECDSLKFDIFNVGSGETTTVGDVANWALASAGHQPAEIVYREDRPQTIPFRVLDCSKIREMLGWQPQHSPQEGVRKTAEWWIENKGWWKK